MGGIATGSARGNGPRGAGRAWPLLLALSCAPAAAQVPPPVAPALPWQVEEAEPAPPALHALLMRRAAQMLALGDVSGARLLYARVAAAGVGAAATALGRTYDPDVLARLGAVGIVPDRAAASALYRAGAAMGDASAEALLAGPGGGGPAARTADAGATGWRVPSAEGWGSADRAPGARAITGATVEDRTAGNGETGAGTTGAGTAGDRAP